MNQNFEEFKSRIENKDIQKIWNNHFGVKKKFFDFFYKDLLFYKKPNILEFGVRHGVSTALFLDVCKINDGFLYSVDINDYSFQFKSDKWKFIHSKDDDYENVENKIPGNFDIIFLDTIHKANHVEKIFYHYYKKLKLGGLFIIDDVSWLYYCKNQKHDHFYKEVNNRETFTKLLEIYKYNYDNFDIEFNFCDTGCAKIKKLSNNIYKSNKISSREFSFKNFARKLFKNFNKL